MDFLIFSDSHGRRNKIDRVLDRQVRMPDAIFFLGDGVGDLCDRERDIPVFRVRGNCDWRIGEENVPEEEILTFEGKRIFLCHGHRFGAKSGTAGLLRAAVERNADIVLFGHTHGQFTETVPAGTQIGSVLLQKPVTLFNPGSIGYAGSFGTLHLTAQTVLFAHGLM